MKLIEALIIAQQEYGIYGDWKAHHMGNALSIGRESSGFYSAYDGGVGVFSRSDRLETVLADLAKRYPYEGVTLGGLPIMTSLEKRNALILLGILIFLAVVYYVFIQVVGW